jgi:hypothetical protein
MVWIWEFPDVEWSKRIRIRVSHGGGCVTNDSERRLRAATINDRRSINFFSNQSRFFGSIGRWHTCFRIPIRSTSLIGFQFQSTNADALNGMARIQCKLATLLKKFENSFGFNARDDFIKGCRILRLVVRRKSSFRSINRLWLTLTPCVSLDHWCLETSRSLTDQRNSTFFDFSAPGRHSMIEKISTSWKYSRIMSSSNQTISHSKIISIHLESQVFHGRAHFGQIKYLSTISSTFHDHSPRIHTVRRSYTWALMVLTTDFGREDHSLHWISRAVHSEDRLHWISCFGRPLSIVVSWRFNIMHAWEWSCPGMEICLSVFARWGRPFAIGRPAEYCSNRAWWWVFTEISRAEIDEGKLFCPITPVFLEWDGSCVKTLAIVMIATESERDVKNKKTLTAIYV